MRTMEEVLQFIRQNNPNCRFLPDEVDGIALKRIENIYNQTQEAKPTPAQSMFAGGPSGPIYDCIRDIWVTNGDHLSFQYTGTESNISRVTKQGGQGIIGKLEQWTIGVTRYYQCVINDEFKHQCIQFLIGEHPRL